MKNTILAFLCVLAVTGWPDETLRPWSERLPTNEEIADEFRTNSTRRFVDSELNNIAAKVFWGTNDYPVQELDRFYYGVMTNVVTMSLEVVRPMMVREGGDFQRRALSWCFLFPFVTNDINAINYLADFIGTVQSRKPDIKKLVEDGKAARAEDIRLGNPTNLVIVNPVYRGLHGEFRGGPLLKDVCDNYRLAKHDEQYFKTHRRLLIEEGFGGAIRGFMSHLPESERPAFRSNIVERARLTPEEQVKVFGK